MPFVCTRCTYVDVLAFVFVYRYRASQRSRFNNAYLYYLPGSIFHFFKGVFRRAVFSRFFAVVGLSCPMLRRRESSINNCIAVQQYRKHSIAQRNQPARSRKASADHSSATTQSSRQRVIFFFFLFFSLVLSSFWTSCGLRCRPFSPPLRAFSLYRA